MNEELALIRTDLEIRRVRQEGRSLPGVFLCYVATDRAGLYMAHVRLSQ